MGDNQLIVTDEEIRNFGEKIKLKSNGGFYHIEDVNVNVNDTLVESGFGFGSSERRLRKWKRIPRELVVKKPSSIKLDGGQNGDLTVSGSSEDDLSSKSSNGGGELKRNGRDEPGKKARGFGVEKEKLSGSMGSDSRSVNFVFVQGGNTVGSGGGRESGVFGKYDEECSDAAYYGDDKDLNEDVPVEFVKSDGEFDDDDVLQEDLAAENDIGKIDPLVESIKGLSFAHDEFEKEVQKWRDIGNNDPLICEDPMHELLEFQDAKILELESVLTSEDTKTVIEDTLMKIIQAEVEYVAIKSTTESLTAEVKHILHQKNVSSQKLDTAEDARKQQNGENLPSQNTQVSKKQAEKLVTREDVKKLQKRVSRFTSCFLIQLILLLVILFLKFSPRNVEIVPT